MLVPPKLDRVVFRYGLDERDGMEFDEREDMAFDEREDMALDGREDMACEERCPRALIGGSMVLTD